jgi:site-specific DNA-cytosine methylase
MARRCRTFDLFTGIGGIALALDEVAEPVEYCEKDAFCTDVLKLPHAP